MNEYDIVQVVEKEHTLVGKYGLFLAHRQDNNCRIEIDNVEYTLSLDSIKLVDGFFVALDLYKETYGYEDIPFAWTIRTPCQKMGVNKDKVFDECVLISELYPFKTFLEAQEYIEEHFKVIQIGYINASAYEQIT